MFKPKQLSRWHYLEYQAWCHHGHSTLGLIFNTLKRSLWFTTIHMVQMAICWRRGHDWVELRDMSDVQTGKIWKQCRRCGELMDVYLT